MLFGTASRRQPPTAISNGFSPKKPNDPRHLFRRKLLLVAAFIVFAWYILFAYARSSSGSSSDLLFLDESQGQEKHGHQRSMRAFSSLSEAQAELLVLPKLACTVDQFYYPDAKASGAGSKHAVILKGGYWQVPQGRHWQSEAAYLEALGHKPVYIKDVFVQIRSGQCVAQFQDLWWYISNSTTTTASSSSAINTKLDLLAFTNDKENPAMFADEAHDKMKYHIPKQVQHIDSFAILSTMTKGQSHQMHKHGESWIGQAAGYKAWWFLPPTVSRPKKVNACDYLTGHEPIPHPDQIQTCIQSPGDVIWFPRDWYHATCSLTDWNIAIGKQLGPRINQNFPTLPREVDRSNPESVQETLQKCAGHAK